jgi:TPR repeat protein
VPVRYACANNQFPLTGRALKGANPGHLNKVIQHEPSTDIVVTTASSQVAPTHYAASPEYNAMVLSLRRQSAPGAATRTHKRSWGQCMRAATVSLRVTASQSAALGYSSAQCNLGYLYYHGLGVEKSLTQAFELFRRAVDAESSTAMFNLALLFLDPDSGCHDPSWAASLLKKCALAGVGEAQNLLEEVHSQEAHRA